MACMSALADRKNSRRPADKLPDSLCAKEVTLMNFKFARYSAIGSRTENEDSFICEQTGPQQMYAAVCDGLGSHGGGREASHIAVEQLRLMHPTQLPTPEEIRSWLDRSNQEILRRRNGPRHMKTTAVALFADRGKVIWAHIGDSRLYHFHNGILADATEDHSVCYLSVRLGDITRREIPNHPDKNKLLKALGEETIAPEIHSALTLEPGEHAFLLCSDGLWERLHEDEILLDLHKSATPEQWLFELRARAEMRRCTDVDNNTAVAVFITV